MIDLGILLLFLLSWVIYLYAWIRLVVKAFKRDARWGWPLLLLNQPLNIPAILFLLFSYQRHHWRYLFALFAPYLMIVLVFWRYVDWTTVFQK